MSGQQPQNNVDMEALLDFSEYDTVNYQSPSLSPSMNSKPSFASPVTAATPTLTPANTQNLAGPSHNYDLYRQQTGFVPGAIASTMAVNQTNNTGYQDFGSLDLLSTFTPENDMFDFNTSPSQATMPASELEMEFDSSADTQMFSTVNPSNIEQDAAGGSPVSQTSSNGRLWPGAHSQAALAKAQAQQRQLMQQRQALQQNKARGKAPQPSDPIVEQKITQLLNSMRAKPASPELDDASNSGNMPRTKKLEEDMDEDEKLLASEEGKKLSSKERRQLRNKVSARAFRSRRKEYISQLEQERDSKDEEVARLRTTNRALLDENKRLSDLTRMLLSSSSFSSFLDQLSTSSTNVAQPAQVKVEPQTAQTAQTEQRQMPKDVNPFGTQSQQHQIGMAMIPEQNMDFSMLNLDNSAFNFQPQVFVVDTPEVPAPFDTSLLSGKTSNFVEELTTQEEKVDMPVIEHPVKKQTVEAVDAAPVYEEFESDPEFALFHAQPTATTATEANDADSETLDIFNGIESEKVLARYELVDASQEEATAVLAMARVQRISDNLESVVSRLELLTMDL